MDSSFEESIPLIEVIQKDGFFVMLDKAMEETLKTKAHSLSHIQKGRWRMPPSFFN